MTLNSDLYNSYEVNRIFWFKEFMGECTLTKYLKKNDPTITEIEIPAECYGFPVTRLQSCFSEAEYIKRVVIPPSISVIGTASFYGCKSLEAAELPEGLEIIGSFAFRETNLKSIVLPKSLKMLRSQAFACCNNLESVVFNSDNSEISIEEKVFVDCHKLPADVTLTGLVNSRDLSEPFDAEAFYDAFYRKSPVIPGQDEYLKYIRPDVLEPAIKNDCFRSVDISVMLEFLIKRRLTESLKLAEQLGLFKNRERVDELIEASAGRVETELTAYLLDLKHRLFGFDGFGEGDKFEL